MVRKDKSYMAFITKITMTIMNGYFQQPPLILKSNLCKI